MTKRRNYIIIGIVILFVATLYWVCYSPWSSRELEKYNQGYGTFDMKSYDVATVYQVLDQTEPQGFHIYEMYFIGDSIFTIVFAALQIILLLQAFSWSKSKVLLRILFSFPIIRGICDMTENISLYYILLTYPQKHVSLINFSDTVTSVKLKLIPVWLLLFLIGMIIKLIIRFNKKDKS